LPNETTVTDIRPNIWRLQATLDINGLVQALKDEDPDIRKRATAALYALGAVDAVPAMREALDKETNTEVRASLVTALAHLGAEDPAAPKAVTAPIEDVSAVDRLLLQLNSEQPERVIQAARALGELKDKTAVEPLVIVFRNTALNGHVRLAAAEGLLALESAPAEVTLLGALRNRKWQLRRNAAAILGQLRADWAVVPLGEALKDPQEIVARTARAALKRIGTREARKILTDNPAPEDQSGDNLSTSETLAITNTPKAPTPLPQTKQLDPNKAATRISRPKGAENLQAIANQLAAKLSQESENKAATPEPPKDSSSEPKKDDAS
jgi:HEAT repeat protein